MSHTTLTVQEIEDIALKIKSGSTNIYTNIGVSMGGPPIELFSASNYINLVSRLLSSDEVTGNNDVKLLGTAIPPKFISDFNLALNEAKQSGVTDAMITKLLSGFIFIKKKQVPSKSWMFVRIQPQLVEQTIKNLPTSGFLSPSSSVQSSPHIQTNLNQSSFNNKHNNKRDNNKDNKRDNLDYDMKRIGTGSPRSNIMSPSFSSFFSQINTIDSKKTSQLGRILPRQNSNNDNESKSITSAYIEILKNTMRSKPYVKIICDMNTGVLSFVNIEDDESFDTTEFKLCSLHSGNNGDIFHPISNDAILKLTSNCYGYITKDSECFDMCYKSKPSYIESAESKEIDELKTKIQTILKTISNDIQTFNAKDLSYKNLEKNLVEKYQELTREKRRYEVELGNIISNIIEFEIISKHPYFEKVKTVTKTKRSELIQYVLPPIPITNYEPISSFFGELETTIDSLRNCSYTFTIGGNFDSTGFYRNGIKFTIDRKHYTTLLLKEPKLKNQIVNKSFNFIKIKNGMLFTFAIDFYGEIINLPQSFTSDYIKLYGNNFGDSKFISVEISPSYDEESFNNAMIQIGRKFVFDLNVDVYHALYEKIDVFYYIGLTYVSKYEYITTLIKNIKNNDINTINLVNQAIDNNPNIIAIPLPSYLDDNKNEVNSFIYMERDAANEILSNNNSLINFKLNDNVYETSVSDFTSFISRITRNPKISSNSDDIISLLKDIKNNNISIVNSRDTNSCYVKFSQLTVIIESIRKQMNNNKLNLIEIPLSSYFDDDDNEINVVVYVKRHVAKEILVSLEVFPSFSDDEDPIMEFELNDKFYEIRASDFNLFIGEIKQNLESLSKKARLDEDTKIGSESKLSLTNLSLKSSNNEEDDWLDCKKEELDKEEVFIPYLKVKTTQDKSRRQKKKTYDENDESKSETGTETSGLTGLSTVSNFFNTSSRFNSSYFDEKFEVFGYEFNGFDADEFLSKFSYIKDFDFGNNMSRLLISEVPLIPQNINYIKDTLFAEEIAYDEEWLNFETDDINNYIAMFYIMTIFGSKCDFIKLESDNTLNGTIKLKHQVQKQDPYFFKKKLPLTFTKQQMNSGNLVKKIATKMKNIDRIVLNARKNTFEILGREITESVFTSVVIAGSNFNFINKNTNITACMDIFNKRMSLISKYENIILPFLISTGSEDSAVYSAIKNYCVFSSKNNDEYFYKNSIIPTSPLYTTYDISDNSYIDNYNEVFSELTNIDFISSLHAVNISQINPELIAVMKILFPNSNIVTLSSCIPVLEDLSRNGLHEDITNNSFYDELIRLSMVKNFYSFIKNNIKSNINFDMEIDNINTIYDWIIEYKDGKRNSLEMKKHVYIRNENIEVSKKNVPLTVENNITDYILIQFENKLRLLDNIIIDNSSFSIINLYVIYISSFKDIPKLLSDRRKYMSEYCCDLCSHIYDVHCELEGSQIITVIDEPFSNFESLIPKGENLYDYASNTLKNFIKTIKNRKICDNVQVRKGYPTDEFDLYMKYRIFEKFSTDLLNCNTSTMFDNILISISYYIRMLSKEIFKETKKDIYYQYLEFNQDVIFDTIAAGTKQTLIENQNTINTDVPTIFKIKTDLDLINSIVLEQENKKNKISKEIESDQQKLIDIFIEYASVIDVIISSYKSKKQSYDKKNSEFEESIKDLQTNLQQILKDYAMVDNFDVKMILSIFSHNKNIYTIRQRIFNEFGFNADNIDLMNDATIYAINEIFTSNYKSNKVDQMKNIDSILRAYGLRYISKVYELENFLTTIFDQAEKRRIKMIFIACKIAGGLFDFISDELIRIKDVMFDKNLQTFSVYTLEEKQKTEDHNKILNYALNTGIKIDSFTKNEIKTLENNITYLSKIMDESLSIIDSGPGMHTLSDCIELFIKLLGELYNNNDNTKETLDDLKSKINSFIKYNRKTINDVINSINFDNFVSIINGTFSNLNTITESIPGFNSGEPVFGTRNDVTVKFVSCIMKTLNDILLFDQIKLIDIFNLINQYGEFHFRYENFNSLIFKLQNFNTSCILFIDEYVDDSNNIIDPESYLILRETHILKTRGLYLNRFYEKINFCIRRFMYDKEENFKYKCTERVRIYIELFLKKIVVLANLEKYIISR